MKKSVNLSRWVLLAVLAIFMGCATTRFATDDLYPPAETARLRLPAIDSTYVYVDVDNTEALIAPVLSRIIDEAEILNRLLEQTNYVLFSAEDDSGGSTAIAVGEFSPGAMAAGLNFNRDWKRITGPDRRWIHPDTGYVLDLSDRGLVVLSSRIKVPGDGVPEDDEDQDAKVSGHFTYALSAADPLSDIVIVAGDLAVVPGLEIPSGVVDVNNIVVTGNVVDTMLVADIDLDLGSSPKARLAGMLLRTYLVAERRRGNDGYFDKSDVSVDGSVVTITSVEIDIDTAVEMIGGDQ